MSEMKPGVSSSAPPKMISTPSATSRAGARPPCSASLKRRHAARPCERISSEPRMRVDDQERDRPPDADGLADLDDDRELRDRDDDEEGDEQDGHLALEATPLVSTRAKPAPGRSGGRRHQIAGWRRTTCTAGSRCRPTSSISVLMCGCGSRSRERHAIRAEAAGEAREVDHQRGVREAQVGQVDDHVAGRPERRGERPAAPSAGRPVLVSGHAQHPELFVEGDDAREPRQICG